MGGLSVCAALEGALHRAPRDLDIEVLYLNAALADDYSYNSMATRQEKLRTFGNFLHAALEDYTPDLLFIACNTLSVLFEDPFYDALRHHPVLGIVETGAMELLHAHRQTPAADIIVFATETTISENAYGSRLAAAGIAADKVVQQACPGLPDAISNDASGALAGRLLDDYIPAAIARFQQPPEQVLGFLGCTHYGYQTPLFAAGLRTYAKSARIINPNLAAADAIVAIISSDDAAKPGRGRRVFRVISRYLIPEKPMKSLPVYLGQHAPETLAALMNFTHRPGMFEGAR